MFSSKNVEKTYKINYSKDIIVQKW